MAVYEVFGRRKWEDALEHVGNVHAADHETALLVARETHFRHNEGVAYAVVRADHLHHVEDPSLLERRTDISYRLQAGYSGFREKRETARAAADARGRGHLRERPVPGASDNTTKRRTGGTTS
jgi:phenylacetate-CoA oxygenase PaaH subunit